jgi:hypothetical protein
VSGVEEIGDEYLKALVALEITDHPWCLLRYWSNASHRIDALGTRRDRACFSNQATSSALNLT